MQAYPLAIMVILYLSQTFPINPPGAEPFLTTSQLWEVLVLKCRKPELFIAPISGSKVLEETEVFIKRTIIFKEGIGLPGGSATEDIILRKPWKADFKNLDSGAFISNIVSQGHDETDLYLTFFFEWPFPNIEPDSKDEKETSDRLWKLARESVQQTIDHARSMVKEGKTAGS